MTDGNRHLEDILLELAESEELGDDRVLAAIEFYPEHRQAILTFYEGWLTADDGRELPPSEHADYVPDISGLWEQPSDVANPFESQSPRERRAVAERCEIPLSVLAALEARSIRATTIPLLLIRRLSQEMKTTMAAMFAFLDGGQAITASDFRSDNPPAQKGKVTFADVIRSASMPEESKSKWLKHSE